jgi:endonuclease G, mitochondrial
MGKLFNSSLRYFILFVLFFSYFFSLGQVYFDMSTSNYSESFTYWTSPSTNSWSVVTTNAGGIPLASSITVNSTAFSTGSTGGIQNGNTNIQFLSTGTTDNSSAAALDLNLNFTGKNAGNLSFDAATVFNQTGNRAGTLRVFYALDGSNWTELSGTDLPFLANNSTAKSSNINIILPSAINNQATVKFRFYYHNGGTVPTGPTGSRPKISIDNLTVSSLSNGPSISVNPSNISNLNYFSGNGPSAFSSYSISGTQLTGDITVSATNDFEIASASNPTFFTNLLILTPASGILNTSISVRLKSGLALGTYSGTILHEGGGILINSIVNLSGTVSEISLPTKLTISSISPSSPLINSPFSVTIVAKDNTNTTQNVSVATTVNLTLNSGTGTLAGNLSAVIPAGSNSVTISGITYNKEETGVSVLASTNGNILTAGNSVNFEVINNVFLNEIKSITSGNWNNPGTWNCNCIPTFTDNVRIRSPHKVSVVPLPTEQGCAYILIEPGAVFDLQTGVFRMNMSPPPVISSNINITMGNPSNALASISTPDNFLLEKPQYVVSYNRSKATSNWVSWYLNSTSIGSTPRQNDFRADNTLPNGWYQVDDNDYSGSGFDRGHMTPSGDRTSSVANNSATFLMTNMIPQAPGNNQGPWEKLESYLRGQLNANGGQEIYIIAGSYGIGGTGTAGTTNTIAAGQITVPAQTYKIALILSNGVDDLNRVTVSTRVIAVLMPNIDSIRPNDWRPYRTSVNAIESATGYDFLSNLPTNIQDILEANVDTITN